MVEQVRTFWKGYLRLALVAIPVKLVSAEKTQATPRFHQIDRQTKQRIRYIKVAPGRGEVAKEDIVMGYEVEPGNYVLMEDGELDSVKLDTRRTIELTQFVDADEIDPLYFDRPYYILPDGEMAEEGYAVLRDALKTSRKIGIGQLTLRGKENLVALYPAGCGKGLVLDTLRYDEEIKDSDKVFAAVGAAKPRADMVQMADQLIESRTERFEPSKFKNHYADAVRDLLRAKLAAGGAVAVEEDDPKQSGQVIDFMEALRRSVGAAAGAAPLQGPAPQKTAASATASNAKRPRATKTSKDASAKSAPARSAATKAVATKAGARKAAAENAAPQRRRG